MATFQASSIFSDGAKSINILTVAIIMDFMGGSSRASTSTSLGVSSGAAKKDIRSKLQHATPQVVANTAVTYVAATNPGVAALYTAYQAAEILYPIVKAGAEEYAKSGDKDKAVEAMGRETETQVKEKIKELTVEQVVSTCVGVAVQSSGIKSDAARDSALTEAVTETITEVTS